MGLSLTGSWGGQSLARFLREPRFSFSGFFPLFPVEQFVANFAEADQIIQVVEFVSLVFIGSVVGLQV